MPTISPTSLTPAAPQQKTTSKPIELKSTLYFHQKPLYKPASYVPDKQKTWYQKLLSATYCQLGGGALALLSFGDIVYNIIYKRGEGSFIVKYILPAVGFLAGLIGFKVSKPPEDPFSVEVIRNGILKVLEKVEEFSKGKANDLRKLTKALFSSKENKDEIRQAINRMLACASAPVKDMLNKSELHCDDPIFLNKLKNLVLQSDNFSLESVHNFVKENDMKFKEFLDRNPDFVRCILQAIFGKRNKGNLRSLIDAINKSLKPAGLALDFRPSSKTNSVNVYFNSSQAFCDSSRPGKEIVPFFVIPTRPQILYKALTQLQKRINQIEEAEEKGESESIDVAARINAKDEFIFSLEDVAPLREIRAGYWLKKEGQKDEKFVIPLNINGLWRKGYFPVLEGLKILQKLASSTDIEQFEDESVEDSFGEEASTSAEDESPEETPIPSAKEIEANVKGPSAEIPAATSESFSKNKFTSINDVLEHWGFEVSEADQEEIRKLIYCLVKAFLNSNPLNLNEDKHVEFVGKMIEELNAMPAFQKFKTLKVFGKSIPKEVCDPKLFQSVASKCGKDVKNLLELIDKQQARPLKDKLAFAPKR